MVRSLFAHLLHRRKVVKKRPKYCPRSFHIISSKVVPEGWAVIVTVTAQPSEMTLISSVSYMHYLYDILVGQKIPETFFQSVTTKGLVT